MWRISNIASIILAAKTFKVRKGPRRSPKLKLSSKIYKRR